MARLNKVLPKKLTVSNEPLVMIQNGFRATKTWFTLDFLMYLAYQIMATVLSF